MLYKKKKFYRYVLTREFTYATKINLPNPIGAPHLDMSAKGILSLYKGYAWDGPILFPHFKCLGRASLVHDALYQLHREAKLHIAHRKEVDVIFYNICIEDDVPRWLAKILYLCVDVFGAKYAKRDVLNAP